MSNKKDISPDTLPFAFYLHLNTYERVLILLEKENNKLESSFQWLFKRSEEEKKANDQLIQSGLKQLKSD